MIDVVLKVATLPERGGDILASEQLITTGGGFNIMSAVARHGVAVTYAGRPGTGVFSDIARGSLQSEDIDAPISPLEGREMGSCIVLVDDEGERTFITTKGAELELRRCDLDDLDVRAGDYVYVSGYNIVYREIATTVSRWVASLPAGVVVAFDPGARVLDIPKDLLDTVLSRTDWLLCNAREARQMTGEDSLDVVVDSLRTRTGSRGVIVRDGSRGCVVSTKGTGTVRCGGYVVDVVDTNGAGDVHNGVFLAELARATSVVDSARRANAAAAISIGSLGPATCPTRAEVTRWLDTSG